MGPGTCPYSEHSAPTPTPRKRWAAQGSQAGPGSQGWSPPSKIHFKKLVPLESCCPCTGETTPSCQRMRRQPCEVRTTPPHLHLCVCAEAALPAMCPAGITPAQPLQSPILPAACRGSARAIPNFRDRQRGGPGARGSDPPGRGSARSGLSDGVSRAETQVARPAPPAAVAVRGRHVLGVRRSEAQLGLTRGLGRRCPVGRLGGNGPGHPVPTPSAPDAAAPG